MYIIEVIPFSRSLRKEYLSYFSSTDIPVGSIVTVDIRNKSVNGLVINVKSADKIKEELKSSGFKLRKIKNVNANTLFKSEFINAAKKSADYFATTAGSIINLISPSPIFSEIKSLIKPKDKSNHIKAEIGEKFLIQDNYEERYSNYKGLIREEFAKKRSVMFLCPTIEDTLRAQELLLKGIEKNIFILHSKLSKKAMVDTWNEIMKHERPVLIISTGSFLGIPRHDIGSIIVEKESSRSYKSQRQPYVDIRIIAEKYAEELEARFFLGDLMLRSEILQRYDLNQFYEYTPLKFRSLSSAYQSIIDMNQDKNNAGDKFSIFSNEVDRIIREAKETNKNTFLFVSRKGLSPIVLCADCGKLVLCHTCNTPVVLHGKDATKEENYFKCHSCGTERSAGENCIKCNSWRLNTYGIGTETVAKEIYHKYPDRKYFVLDSITAKTHKQARDIVDQFYKTPGSILVGTEMAILYLREAVENIAIVSIDSLFSIPDYSIREKILRMLLQMRGRANNNFCIQTRRPEDKIFDYAKQGNLADFYREEFSARAKFKYPPFSILIKISISGPRVSVEREMESIVEFLAPYKFQSFPAYKDVVRGKFTMHAVLKLPRQKWVDEELKNKLLNLPPQIRVMVDADSIL